jgi:hypothetical protein
MGRPENPITADSPEALLALDLREVRVLADNPKLRTMADRSGYSIAALSKAASGKAFPTWECTRAYLIGCDVQDGKVFNDFRRKWEATQKAVKLRRSVADSGNFPGRARGVSKVALRSTLPSMAPMPDPLSPETQTGEEQIIDLYTSSPGRYPLAELNQVTSSQELVDALNDLVARSGHTATGLVARIGASNLPTIGHRNGTTISAGTVRDVLAGRRRLTCEAVVRIVDACGGTEQEKAVWSAHCRRVQRIKRRAQAALDDVKQDLHQQGLLSEESPDRDKHRAGVHRADERLRSLMLFLAGVLCIFGAGVLAIYVFGLAN